MKFDDLDLDDLIGDIGTKEPASFVGADELADFLGVTGRTVRKMKDTGLIPPLDRGRYDLRASIRAYCQHVRAQAAGRGNASSGLTAERERQARAGADKIELENAARRRELVPAADVEKEWTSILRDVRAAMLALPSRVQQRVNLSPHDAATLDREIRDALDEIADARA